MKRRLKKKDVWFLGALLAFCLLVFGLSRIGFQKAGASVTVTVDGSVFGTYLLAVPQTIEITDENGTVTNVLQISDGKADMTSADCPDGLCVNQRAISAENETIVCLPNRVVVTVTGSDTEGMDGFAQ